MICRPRLHLLLAWLGLLAKVDGRISRRCGTNSQTTSSHQNSQVSSRLEAGTAHPIRMNHIQPEPVVRRTNRKMILAQTIGAKGGAVSRKKPKKVPRKSQSRPNRNTMTMT